MFDHSFALDDPFVFDPSFALDHHFLFDRFGRLRPKVVKQGPCRAPSLTRAWPPLLPEAVSRAGPRPLSMVVVKRSLKTSAGPSKWSNAILGPARNRMPGGGIRAECAARVV